MTGPTDGPTSRPSTASSTSETSGQSERGTAYFGQPDPRRCQYCGDLMRQPDRRPCPMCNPTREGVPLITEEARRDRS